MDFLHAITHGIVEVRVSALREAPIARILSVERGNEAILYMIAMQLLPACNHDHERALQLAQSHFDAFRAAQRKADEECTS